MAWELDPRLAKEFDSLKAELCAVIMSAQRGLTVEGLLKDYQDVFSCELPLHRFGFESVMAMATAMPDTIRTDGTILKAVADDRTAHIQSLIDKQKAPRSRHSGPKASGMMAQGNAERDDGYVKTGLGWSPEKRRSGQHLVQTSLQSPKTQQRNAYAGQGGNSNTGVFQQVADELSSPAKASGAAPGNSERHEGNLETGLGWNQERGHAEHRPARTSLQCPEAQKRNTYPRGGNSNVGVIRPLGDGLSSPAKASGAAPGNSQRCEGNLETGLGWSRGRGHAEQRPARTSLQFPEAERRNTYPQGGHSNVGVIRPLGDGLSSPAKASGAAPGNSERHEGNLETGLGWNRGRGHAEQRPARTSLQCPEAQKRNTYPRGGHSIVGVIRQHGDGPSSPAKASGAAPGNSERHEGNLEMGLGWSQGRGHAEQRPVTTSLQCPEAQKRNTYPRGGNSNVGVIRPLGDGLSSPAKASGAAPGNSQRCEGNLETGLGWSRGRGHAEQRPARTSLQCPEAQKRNTYPRGGNSNVGVIRPLGDGLSSPAKASGAAPGNSQRCEGNLETGLGWNRGRGHAEQRPARTRLQCPEAQKRNTYPRGGHSNVGVIRQHGDGPSSPAKASGAAPGNSERHEGNLETGLGWSRGRGHAEQRPARTSLQFPEAQKRNTYPRGGHSNVGVIRQLGDGSSSPAKASGSKASDAAPGNSERYEGNLETGLGWSRGREHGDRRPARTSLQIPEVQERITYGQGGHSNMGVIEELTDEMARLSTSDKQLDSSVNKDGPSREFPSQDVRQNKLFLARQASLLPRPGPIDGSPYYHRAQQPVQSTVKNTWKFPRAPGDKSNASIRADVKNSSGSTGCGISLATGKFGSADGCQPQVGIGNPSRATQKAIGMQAQATAVDAKLSIVPTKHRPMNPFLRGGVARLSLDVQENRLGVPSPPAPVVRRSVQESRRASTRPSSVSNPIPPMALSSNKAAGGQNAGTSKTSSGTVSEDTPTTATENPSRVVRVREGGGVRFTVTFNNFPTSLRR